MADYFISGKKGNGKGIYALGVIRDALVEGKRVATNMDVKLFELMSLQSKKHIIRLPDVINVHDLEALGQGQAGVVEDDNGIIVLDEVSKIFNARDWNDKARSPVLDWLTHSRKYGWDTYMSAQGSVQIDKQLRACLLEYHVSVTRTDKWKLPFIGWLGKLRPCGKPFTFPKFHLGTIRQGFHQDAFVVDQKWFRGPPLYAAYDTQQIFKDRLPENPSKEDFERCSDGMYSVLSPWHTHGRYEPPAKPSGVALVKVLATGENPHARSLPRLKPKAKHPIVEIIMRLPVDERIRHLKRLELLNLWDRRGEAHPLVRHGLTLVGDIDQPYAYRDVPKPKLFAVA